MNSQLNLIKTDFKETEKRIFPRFPFSFLTFKKDSDTRASEVKDISYTGMQLCIKKVDHDSKVGETVSGTLNWRGVSLSLSGKVMWINGTRVGLSFSDNEKFSKEIKKFLSVQNIVASMRPLHSQKFDLELPADLKFWLQADGPVELFVWSHRNGEASRFQMIMMDQFIEWEDGKGLRSGKIITKRDMATPLFSEDEFIFEIDEQIDAAKIHFARKICNEIPKSYLSDKVFELIKLKTEIPS